MSLLACTYYFDVKTATAPSPVSLVTPLSSGSMAANIFSGTSGCIS
jgi:hypothetical protein